MPLLEELESEGNFLFKRRSFLPIILLVVALAVYLMNGQTINNELFIASLVTSLIGLLIRVHTVGHTPKNTSGRNTAEGQVAETVNKTGFYSIVRHPLYLGNFFMYMGFAVISGNIWFVVTCILAFWVYYERIMIAEEEFLRDKFGEQYTSWASITPPFIPAFGNWTKPSLTFSMKKVLKKEKNGLFAVFVIFLAFLTLKHYQLTKLWVQPIEWMFYATIFTGVLYFILKYLKSKTKVLDEEDR
ncbi:MAG: isoprenylcysteine carboxylmethyltransferase family protein [Saprospiraceae bacterium]|nr:DUF1295 domain-containing protein [Saprospiraceae bacterium]MBP7642691.1 DUF1295 domain-containing protein [Saprospiraceae bacterium]